MDRSITHRLAATTTLAVLATALALPALAQPQPGPEGQPHHRMGQRPGADAMGRDQQRQAHRDERIRQLKTQLKLTPAQESAWTTFAAAMQPGERKPGLERADMAKLTTPERIDRMRAMRSQHAAEADRREDATKAFYATLTPEQQKTFDAQAFKGGRRHSNPEQAHHGMHGGTRGGPMGQAAPAPAQK